MTTDTMTAAVGTGFRLSMQQELAWSTRSSLQPGDAAVILAPLHGQIDPVLIESALRQVISRHDILRTVYRRQAGAKLPFQVILDKLDPYIEQHNLTRLEEDAQREAVQAFFERECKRKFALAEGPVLACLILTLGPGRYELIVGLPALSIDRRSLQNLVREIAQICVGPASVLDTDVMQYADFVEWQRELFTADEMRPGREYWRRFAEAHVADRRADRRAGLELLAETASADLSAEGGEVHTIAAFDRVAIDLTSDCLSQLEELSAHAGVETSDLLLAAWSTLLSRYVGDQEPIISTHFHGRKYEELQSVLGNYTIFLPVSVPWNAEASFMDFARRAAASVSEAAKWQESYTPDLVTGADMSGKESAVGYEFSFVDVRGIGLGYGYVGMYAGGGGQGFRLECVRSGEGLRLELGYGAGRYGKRGVERLLGHYAVLLGAAVRDGEQRIGDLPLLSESEQGELVELWCGEAVESPRCSVGELVAEQAERTPERVAVRCGESSLSYAELNRQANRLAHRLRGLGVGAGTVVGLCVERSVGMVAAVLGILKSGGAYVPLSAEHPRSRLERQLAGVSVLVSERGLAERLQWYSGAMVWLEELGEEREENLEAVSGAEDLAYVMYTSGSTGEPKGVEVTQGNLLNYSWSIQQLLGLSEEPLGLCFAMVSTLSADLGHTCLYPALLSGGTVDVVPYGVATDGEQMAGYMAGHGVDVLKIVPSHLESLLATGGAGVLPQRYLITGGEGLRPGLVEAVEGSGAGCRLINHYGPTETTVGSLVHPLERGERWPGQTVPIGRPLANTWVYVLDERGQVCPAGIAGELYIGGQGVARGYRNRPELTAERFVADRFRGGAGARLYRTGDRVRSGWDGQIEYLGRVDDQVKVRGYRVEPGEIAGVLERQPEVRQAVVVAREDARGEIGLTGYVVLREGQAAGGGELAGRLRAELPEYMVPQAVVVLPRLPLTRNGKLDRSALPLPEAVTQQSYQPPQTPTQQLVAEIWAEVLKLPRIGRDDDFFLLGGHSLIATQVIARICRTFNIGLPLRALFESPTLASLAKRIESARSADSRPPAPPMTGAPRTELLPLSYAQQRLWVLDQLEPNNPLYNIPRTIRITGALNTQVLERVLNEIVRRHASLRTIFPVVHREPVQKILDRVVLTLASVDLTLVAADRRETEARALATYEAVQPFDLTQAPLLRATLLTLAADDHVLLLTMHHIVSDAWSAAVFLEEFGILYQAYAAGQASPLPDPSMQYADYAVWQRNWLQGKALGTMLHFWRETLAGAPEVLHLRTDRPRPARQTFAGGHLQAMLPMALLDAVKMMGRKESTTLFMTLLAAFQAQLAAYSGEKQMVVGTDVANRPTLETERMIGFFINLLPLRTDLSGDPTFRELLTRVRETTLAAYAYQDMPFDRLVQELRPERSLSHTPLVQVLFVMQNTPSPPKEFAGLRFSRFEVPVTRSKFDVAVFVHEAAEGLQCHWIYSTDLFERRSVERMARHFETLLRSAVADPDIRLSALELESTEEKQQQLAASHARRRSQFESLLAAAPKPVNLGQQKSAGD